MTRNGASLTFVRLVVHNVATRRLRLAFTATAVGIGVLTVVALGIVDSSLRGSALAIMQIGRADFTIAQKGVSDLLNSNIDEATVGRIAADHRIASTTGVLVGTTKLNASNPLFLEIGVDPSRLAEFGVTIDAGAAFGAQAQDAVMLGWRAANNLGKHVGDTITIDDLPLRVVGIYSTGQALGDAGAMRPLIPFQAEQRQPSEVTLVFVRVRDGTNIPSLRADLEREYPQLVTVQTISDFGRADRSLALITAADRAGSVLAILTARSSS
jgi:ABC-type lipoprotein release transport system permease subunit